MNTLDTLVVFFHRLGSLFVAGDERGESTYDQLFSEMRTRIQSRYY